MLLLALPCPPVRLNYTNGERLNDFHEMRHSEDFNESYEHVMVLIEVTHNGHFAPTPAHVSCPHLDCNSQRIYLKGNLYTKT